MAHRRVIVRVRHDLLELIRVALVTKLEHDLLRLNLTAKVADNCSVFGYCRFVILTFSIWNSYIIHCANCEYALLEILQLDHILRICREELIFRFSQLFRSFISLKYIFTINREASNAYRGRNAD